MYRCSSWHVSRPLPCTALASPCSLRRRGRRGWWRLAGTSGARRVHSLDLKKQQKNREGGDTGPSAPPVSGLAQRCIVRRGLRKLQDLGALHTCVFVCVCVCRVTVQLLQEHLLRVRWQDTLVNGLAAKRTLCFLKLAPHPTLTYHTLSDVCLLRGIEFT